MPMHNSALTFLSEHLRDLPYSLEHARHTLPDNAHVFDGDLEGLIRDVTASGSHYFSPGAIAFFDAQNHDLINARFLITSRQFTDSAGVSNPRTYHVVWFIRRKDGQLDNWSLDTAFASERAAVEAAHALGEYLSR